MATTLVCKQCNFENEPERVYCHNCGAKLDRSLLPPEASKREDPVLVQQRVRKMVKPRNISLQVQLKNLVYSLLLSAVLAAIVVIVKPPENIVVVSQEAAMDALSITDDLDADLQLPTPRRRPYTEDQLNAFLAASLRGGKVDKAGGVPAVSFERAYVHLDDNVIHLTQQNSVFGFPIYATTNRTLSVEGGKLVSKAMGGQLGRLPIPAAAMPVFDYLFQPLQKAGERQLKILSQMQAINVYKGRIDFTTSGRR